MLIGGGPECQLVYREIVGKALGMMGVGMLPEEAFGPTPFCTDWVDTTESQRILQYQKRSFDDYLADMIKLVGFRRYLIRLFRPIARSYLLRRSPYLPRPNRGYVDWRGKVAVVTGASGGIGAEVARKLAREGLRVVLVARSEEHLAELAAEIRAAGGEAIVVAADLSQEEECRRVYEQVQQAYGAVDVLVNNAGLGWYGFGADMPWALAQRMLQVNVAAVVRLTLLFLADMKERSKGHIINVSSIAGSLPSQGIALYGATKSFVDTFTTALHRELRGSNVRISVIRPGAVATRFFRRSSAEEGALPMPAEKLAIKPEVIANRIWSLLRRPARVAHVPRLLGLVPWVELCFGWLIDLLGPALLRRQLKAARGKA